VICSVRLLIASYSETHCILGIALVLGRASCARRAFGQRCRGCGKTNMHYLEKKRVTVVDLGMDERRGNGLSSGIVESVPDSTKVTNG